MQRFQDFVRSKDQITEGWLGDLLSRSHSPSRDLFLKGPKKVATPQYYRDANILAETARQLRLLAFKITDPAVRRWLEQVIAPAFDKKAKIFYDQAKAIFQLRGGKGDFVSYPEAIPLKNAVQPEPAQHTIPRDYDPGKDAQKMAKAAGQLRKLAIKFSDTEIGKWVYKVVAPTFDSQARVLHDKTVGKKIVSPDKG